jgi:hypothetical protein
MIVCRWGPRFPCPRFPVRGVIVWMRAPRDLAPRDLAPRDPNSTRWPLSSPGLWRVVTMRTMCEFRLPDRAGADITRNTGASAWSRTRHPPFGEAGARSLTGSREKRARAQNRTGVAQGRPVYSRRGVHRPPLAWGDYPVSIRAREVHNLLCCLYTIITALSEGVEPPLPGP